MKTERKIDPLTGKLETFYCFDNVEEAIKWLRSDDDKPKDKSVSWKVER